VLTVSNLRKRFGERVALDDVSFKVDAGETIGLLGPNGAGKTTTLSMMCGLARPDSGSVSFQGKVVQNTNQFKQRVGLVPQDLALYDELPASANLELFGGLYGLEGKELARRADAALELVGLETRRRDRVKTFSGGMKRRLNIAAALLHDPELILLDEPTVGVDPQSRNAIFENLEELKRRGKTLIYTTHYMEEAERLCDRVVIIDHGKVLADDTVRGLYRLLPAAQAVVLEIDGPAPPAGMMASLATLPGISSVEYIAGGIQIETDDFGTPLARALGIIANHGLRVASVRTAQPSLENVFISLTGHAMRDGPQIPA
jgi:ABC-2 type transport system ATP-binding protein